MYKNVFVWCALPYSTRAPVAKEWETAILGHNWRNHKSTCVFVYPISETCFLIGVTQAGLFIITPTNLEDCSHNSCVLYKSILVGEVIQLIWWMSGGGRKHYGDKWRKRHGKIKEKARKDKVGTELAAWVRLACRHGFIYLSVPLPFLHPFPPFFMHTINYSPSQAEPPTLPATYHVVWDKHGFVWLHSVAELMVRLCSAEYLSRLSAV